MPEARSELKYPILVTQRRGGYELRIPELLIVVRSETLQAGLDELHVRVSKIFDSARALDALDEIPAPRPPAPLRVVSPLPARR